MFKKNDIFNKTRIRIIMISNLIVFLCLFAFVFVFQIIYSANVYKDTDIILSNRIYYIQEELIKADLIDRIFIEIDLEDIFNKRVESSLITIIYENELPVVASENPYFDVYDLDDINIKKEGNIQNININNYNFRAIKFKYNQYEVEVLSNIDYQLESIKNMTNSVILALIVLLIISLILSKILAQKVLEPIKNAYDKQLYFVQDASHEMRTPLTIIKGKLELLGRELDFDDEKFKYISNMMSEIRGLEKLNTDLLTLTKEDTGLEINAKQIDLHDFIEEISEFYFDLADIQIKTFELENVSKGEFVVWDIQKMKRSIVILLENAFKYTNENDNIRLIIKSNNKQIVVKVIDSGIGISKENQNRVFDRFYRSDDVRAKNISGSGIGLSMLKAISISLDFKIFLKSEQKKFTEFTLIIPRNM